MNTLLLNQLHELHRAEASDVAINNLLGRYWGNVNLTHTPVLEKFVDLWRETPLPLAARLWDWATNQQTNGKKLHTMRIVSAMSGAQPQATDFPWGKLLDALSPSHHHTSRRQVTRFLSHNVMASPQDMLTILSKLEHRHYEVLLPPILRAHPHWLPEVETHLGQPVDSKIIWSALAINVNALDECLPLRDRISSDDLIKKMSGFLFSDPHYTYSAGGVQRFVEWCQSGHAVPQWKSGELEELEQLWRFLDGKVLAPPASLVVKAFASQHQFQLPASSLLPALLEKSVLLSELQQLESATSKATRKM